MLKNKSSIQKSFLRNNIAIVITAVGLWLLIWIQGEYSEFRVEAGLIKKTYIEQQKKLLKSEVNNTVKYIDKIIVQTEQTLKSVLRQRVHQAYQTASNIYFHNREKRTPEEMNEMIRDSLLQSDCENDRQCNYVGSMDDICRRFSLPKNSPDISAVIETGEGAIGYFSDRNKAKTPNGSSKIIFAKYFKPMNWYICTVEPFEVYRKELQQGVLKHLVLLRFDAEGYFFGSTLAGDPLFSNGKITLGGRNISDLTDVHGVKVIQNQIKAAMSPEGGFVNYSWPKIGSSNTHPKISFVKKVPEWGWIIGAGVYTDTIEDIIGKKKSVLYTGLKQRVFRSGLVLFVLLSLIFFWSRQISNQIQQTIATLLAFLKKASSDSITIDPDKLHFEEFTAVAMSINTMLQKRQMAEKALHESEKQYRLLADNATDNIWILRLADMRMIYSSPFIERLLGYSPEEFLKLRLDQYITEESLEEIKKTIAEELDKEKANNFDLEIGTALQIELFKKDNSHLWVEVKGTFLRNEDDEIDRVLGISRDISERRLAEQEKIMAQKTAAEHEKLALVGQIAGKMSHDFNNILGVIMGNAEIALLDCKEEETRKTLELIFDQTKKGKNLTKNLVAFAKDQEPMHEFFKISEKIDLVVNLLKKDLGDITVIREYDDDLPDLLADPGMIEHALVNIIQNSIHALSLEKNPVIIIRAFFREKHICLEIEDNGCGIPKEYLQSVYEPSFTLKGSKDVDGLYKTGIKGTGYGMANVKKYIGQHQGTIDLSTEPGSGTTFIISLPVIKRELTIEEKTELKKTNLHSHKKILLVEDEKSIADVQKMILTEEPCYHDVDLAGNGVVAVELFNSNKYDIVSLDYILPGDLNGMDIYHHIRKTDKEIPILFISGNIEFLESIKELKQKDINTDHLSKPCQNTDYLNRLNSLLDKVLSQSVS